MTALPGAPRDRRSQADRRARTRSALLEAAARGLSRHGYRNLVLEQVAAEAGYTRGALYHLFAGKEELALAVVEWVEQTWWAHMASVLDDDADPVAALIAVARAHAVYCRRDIARVVMTLRLEFGDRDHPVAHAVRDVERRVVDQAAQRIAAGRRSGAIPPGPPARIMARAFAGALEGLVINVAGEPRYDQLLAERAARGVLGVAPA